MSTLVKLVPGVQVVLTPAEAKHLVTLLERNEEEGPRFGPGRFHWRRSESLRAKLEHALGAEDEDP